MVTIASKVNSPYHHYNKYESALLDKTPSFIKNSERNETQVKHGDGSRVSSNLLYHNIKS